MFMGWLWLVGSTKLEVSFAKEPYKRDDILQKRLIILSILLTVATPYMYIYMYMYIHVHLNVYIHARVHIYIYIHTFLDIYAYIHT